ncbi:putative tetraacyldisaccharide 4'-kinase, mitochondrial [Apostasia shenzhenica]|uniref:tetraacyldisaccharide 4'-kinase n=1 Tax=Apostasia shenzhenica TaxID=1088818 RepID=A0A2H9ZZD0_9ASPA|nr:putative tetraacyldisaccharide 4'-kinase, mitochondrial [Apostasia shenzhenica]
MLQRHLLHTNAKVGVGVNRFGTASAMFDIYGCMDLSRPLYWEKLLSPHNFGPHCRDEKIGVVILDDGMQVNNIMVIGTLDCSLIVSADMVCNRQHLSLCRDVEIVMINGLAPWGNEHLIPRGSLREPLNALGRAHIGVILHADLVSIKELKDIVTTMRKFSPAIRVFFSSLAPLFFFEVKNPQAKLSLNMMIDKVILCVSAIGFPDAFIQSIKKDINLIRKRLKLLEDRFGLEVIVIITEKDYDRNPTILEKVDDFLIVVLCSSLQIMPFEDRTDEDFRMVLRKLLLCRSGFVA